MEMSGERLIEAPRETVWAALNDPQILKACIPGCETVEKLSDTEMKAAAVIELGSISARFDGKVLLSDLDPPNGYTISGDGQVGTASFAKGGARVNLLDDRGATRLIYNLDAQMHGEMAQLGSGVLDSRAKQYVDSFFTRLAAIVVPAAAQAPGIVEAQRTVDGKPPETVLLGPEQVSPGAGAPPYDPQAHPVHAESYHPPPPDDHAHDPSNPHYFGLPAGVIIAAMVAGISVCIVLYKFLG